MGRLLSVYMFTDDTILKDLNRDSNELQSIQKFYLGASEHIKSIFFHELLPTPLMKGVAELVKGDRNAEVIALYGDHCQIVKFEEREENDYRKVIGHLSKLVKEAPGEAKRNWDKEKRHKSAKACKSATNYVQRPHIQDFLTEKLLPSDTPKVQPRCVLHGLGGSGKTQVASFWIEENKNRQNQIEADLETAIRSLGPVWSEGSWEDAVAYLSREKGWLLFFDNADGSDLRLEDYLPNSTNGAVLVTTRNRDCVSYAPDSHMRVGEMSEIEAVDLLHSVANVHPSSNDTSIAIVKELGKLALAITQAGAYIFKTRQLDRYLGIFQKHRAKLMREASLKGRNYEGSTYTAFDLSFRLLPEKSQKFMKICAFLHHSHIPQALFEQSITNGFRSNFDVEGYPPMPNTEILISSLEDTFGSEWDDDAFKELVEPIFQSSLINDGFTDQEEQIFYNVHPLVQTYIQDDLAIGEKDHYAISAGQLLVGGVRSSEYDNRWDRELLPHINNLPTSIKEVHISYAGTFARAYKSAGRWNDSLALWKYCDIECTKEFGQRNTTRMSIRSRLAIALGECGEWREVENIQREVLEVRREILGLRHPDTITAMNNLAYTLGHHRQLEEDEKIQREVLEARREILGLRHPDTITAMNNLAITLGHRGQLGEAEKIQREVLEVSREILGLRHPDTITAMNNLAHTLIHRGQLEEAEKIQREVLEVREEILGLQHPDTITAMSNLASTLGHRGQLEEAEKIQREVLEVRREILGLRHPDTIRAMNNLASTLGDRGQLEEAEKMKREVLEVRREILGLRHPDTITAMSNLASTLGDCGQLEEAEKIQREVLEVRKEILGLQHPDTITVMSNLASTLGHCGQLEEAEKMKREVLEVRREILGLRHPDTITAMNNLAYTLGDLGQLEEAEKIQREVLEAMREILGLRHPDTIMAMNNLAWILQECGKLEEAEKLEKDAMAGFTPFSDSLIECWAASQSRHDNSYGVDYWGNEEVGKISYQKSEAKPDQKTGHAYPVSNRFSLDESHGCPWSNAKPKPPLRPLHFHAHMSSTMIECTIKEATTQILESPLKTCAVTFTLASLGYLTIKSAQNMISRKRETHPYPPGPPSRSLANCNHTQITLASCQWGGERRWASGYWEAVLAPDNPTAAHYIIVSTREVHNRDRQMVYSYQPGIGTYAPPGVAGTIKQALVKTADLLVAWCLNQHEVLMVVTRRGPYTARALAGMVHWVGLLPQGNHEQGATEGSSLKRHFVKLDTVASVGLLLPKTLPFVSNDTVKTFRHAVSLDEHRKRFDVTLWNPNEEVTGGLSILQDASVKEVWFADVGGGHVKDGTSPNLANISLRWMLSEIKNHSSILFSDERLDKYGIPKDCVPRAPYQKNVHTVSRLGNDEIKSTRIGSIEVAPPGANIPKWEEADEIDCAAEVHDMLRLNPLCKLETVWLIDDDISLALMVWGDESFPETGGIGSTIATRISLIALDFLIHRPNVSLENQNIIYYIPVVVASVRVRALNPADLQTSSQPGLADILWVAECPAYTIRKHTMQQILPNIGPISLEGQILHYSTEFIDSSFPGSWNIPYANRPIYIMAVGMLPIIQQPVLVSPTTEHNKVRSKMDLKDMAPGDLVAKIFDSPFESLIISFSVASLGYLAMKGEDSLT
ncbi:14721_t:CDS:10, partial [Acaulospora colombiana]